MSLHYYMKNIFFAVFVLFFLIAPKLVNADYDFGTTHAEALKKAGWTDQQIKKLDENVNNLKSESYHKPSNGSTQVVNLYDDTKRAEGEYDWGEGKLTPLEKNALRAKLAEGNSPYENRFNDSNLYKINNTNTTDYVFDPTPDDKTNNDEIALGTATKEGSFLLYKNPVAKEVSGRTQNENISTKDVSSLDGVLNAIDIANKRESGETVTLKNREYNKKQEKLELQKIYDEKLEKLKDAQEAFASDPSDVNRAILEAAKKEEGKAGDDVRVKGNDVAKIEDAKAQAARKKVDTTPEGCRSTITHPLAPIDSLYCILTFVGKGTNIVLNLTSYFAYITGTLFDYSLEFSINSAEFFKKLGVIEITWSFIRDILNITFIFILLWTAVQILIGNEGKYNAKKILMNVVIFAILMNFSLFAAKFMVDTSNVVSLKIYESMKADSAGNKASISARIMNTVGLSTLYNITEIFNSDKIRAKGTCAADPGKLIIVSVMGSVLLIVMSLALGLAAILFLIRLVNIIFLFIKSPLWVWGNVLPGNPYMSKITRDWWSSMKHVLVFPILYLFWMLIAIIVFEKLGQVKTVAADGSTQNGVSLLDLICNGPGAGNIGQSISLIAIFAIVIIFMMMAIKYGFRHAGDGGEESLGKGMASSMAKRFSGFQTAMTTGLAKKAGGISVGAANRGIKIAGNTSARLGGTGVGAYRNWKKGDDVLKGAKDGFLNPGINIKEGLGDLARTQAINGGFVGKITGINKFAGKLAKKYEDPTNSLGETRKKADQRRTAATLAEEADKQAAIDKKYKIETFEDWKKKKGNANKTADDYESYVETTMIERMKKTFGKDIVNMQGNNKDANGNPTTHLQDIMSKSISKTIDPTNGQVLKIKFNEYDASGVIEDMLKHDTTREKIKEKKTKFTTFRNIKAEARIKAITEANKANRSKTRTKKTQSETTEHLQKITEALRKKIEGTPSESDIKTKIDFNNSSQKIPYTGDGQSEETVREINNIVNRYNSYVNGTANPTQSVLDGMQNELIEKLQKHNEYINKQKTELLKKERELDSHLEKIKKAEEAEKNK